MEPLPLRIAHPKTYIVEDAVSCLSGLGAGKETSWGRGPGGVVRGGPGACNLARLRMG